MKPTMEELALNVVEAEWDWLRAHLERGGLIVVGQELDIVDVGMAIAADDAAMVNGWVAAGKLTKPSAAEIAAWDCDRGRKFLSLIVSPFVLIQEIPALVQ